MPLQSPMTKVSNKLAGLGMKSPAAGFMISGDGFRVPDTVQKHPRQAPSKEVTTTGRKEVTTTRDEDRGVSPAVSMPPSPAIGSLGTLDAPPAFPFDEDLPTSSGGGDAGRSSKKRGFVGDHQASHGDQPNVLRSSSSLSVEVPELDACVSLDLGSLPPMRPSQSPVLTHGSRPCFTSRARTHDDENGSTLGRMQSLDGCLSARRAMSSERGVSSVSRSDSSFMPTRGALSSNTATVPGHPKRFRQSPVPVPSSDSMAEPYLARPKPLSPATADISGFVSRSAPAEVTLPDMTPAKQLLDTVATTSGCDAIDGDTLQRLIMRETPHSNYFIIDCRFPFEHEGGCIDSAQTCNCWTPQELERLFFPDQEVVEGREKTAIVFHCEFSSKRAPKLLQHLRALDRKIVPTSEYPRLCYPEVYLLEGGYKKFHATHRCLCRTPPQVPARPTIADDSEEESTPACTSARRRAATAAAGGGVACSGCLYTPMNDELHEETCKKYHAEYKSAWKSVARSQRRHTSDRSRRTGRDRSPAAVRRVGGGSEPTGGRLGLQRFHSLDRGRGDDRRNGCTPRGLLTDTGSTADMHMFPVMDGSAMYINSAGGGGGGSGGSGGGGGGGGGGGSESSGAEVVVPTDRDVQ